MKSERTKVEFPLWRKKVDSSLFQHNGTTIPKWACRMWDLETVSPGRKGKKDEQSNITIVFNKKSFVGQITCSWPTKRADKVYRLWFEDDLKGELKEIFLMSCMRDIEDRLRSTREIEIEKNIPFWEFLDIEFDQNNKTILMTAHYTQEPVFPELFRRLTDSPALKRIDDELTGKGEFRIYKQDWRPREDYETEIGADNIIYMLIDTAKKLIYIGEAENLIRRFNAGHPTINEWDYYRYDVLPPMPKKQRVAFERMLIRLFASVLHNKREVPTMAISNYRLTNEKIDT